MLDYEENDAVEYTTAIADLDSEVESATAITEEEEEEDEVEEEEQEEEGGERGSLKR